MKQAILPFANLAFLSLTLLLPCCMKEDHQPDPVLVIFDTDFGPDYDDVGAMAVMHALADSGKVEILATMASTSYPNVAANLSAFNTWFGRPGIPVGVPGEGSLDMRDWQGWSDTIVNRYPHPIESNSEARQAVDLYRELLASQADSSVTVVTVGFLTNLYDLLESVPDKYSELNGFQLVSRKVKRLVSMAGAFPAGREFNVYMDSASAYHAFSKWPTEIIFSGWEIGSRIFTGIPLIESSTINNNPVKDVFRISTAMYPADSAGRMSWDQTAIFVAINGVEPHYTAIPGRIVVNEDGSNTWDDNARGHYYLKESLPAPEMQKMLNALMMHLPARTNPPGN